jgi:hypothetical protein
MDASGWFVGSPRPLEAALWLVGDAGVYLMSNGRLPILYDGRIVSVEEARHRVRLCAHAGGCGPEDEVDDWWPVPTEIEGGDDFCRSLPVDLILSVLSDSRRYVVILASPDATEIFGNVDRE